MGRKFVMSALLPGALLFGHPFVPLASADGPEANAPTRTEGPPSSNFHKTEKFLPGEEVVSPTGQRMKVWSTEGPVPVSRAPEPFEDREKTVINDENVIIDAEVGGGRRGIERRP